MDSFDVENLKRIRELLNNPPDLEAMVVSGELQRKGQGWYMPTSETAMEAIKPFVIGVKSDKHGKLTAFQVQKPRKRATLPGRTS